MIITYDYMFSATTCGLCKHEYPISILLLIFGETPHFRSVVRTNMYLTKTHLDVILYFHYSASINSHHWISFCTNVDLYSALRSEVLKFENILRCSNNFYMFIDTSHTLLFSMYLLSFRYFKRIQRY